MRIPLLLALAPLFSQFAPSVQAQRMDPALRGNWTLDVAASSFGQDGRPTAGTVRWTAHGWVLALVFASGYVYADAVVTDHGCALIGVPADYTCTVSVLSPRHVRFTLHQNGITKRIGDIELADSNTTRTVHRVTPASGAPYTETTVWTREHE